MSGFETSREPHWPPLWARGLGAGEAGSEALYLALEAGGWPGALDDGQRRAFALIVLALLDARQQGATRLPLARLAERLPRFGADEADCAAAATLALALTRGPAPLPLAPYVGRPGDYKPFIVDGDYLYSERELRLEAQLAVALARRLHIPAETAASSVSAPTGFAWTSEQAAAIRGGLPAPVRRHLGRARLGQDRRHRRHRPGLERPRDPARPDRDCRADREGGQPHRRAPAGRRADATHAASPPGLRRPEPGAPTGDFRHHENHPLPHAAVIVDEASMVGLALMSQLIRALGPDARLVLMVTPISSPPLKWGTSSPTSDRRRYGSPAVTA